jgi:hypothetical protein
MASKPNAQASARRSFWRSCESGLSGRSVIVRGIGEKLLAWICIVFLGSKVMTEASLDKVYAEVKRVRVKLESIEKTLESLRASLLPEETVSPEEIRELQALRREAKKHPENLVPLEEVLKKHGAKKRA